MTQGEFADTVGVSRGAMSYYEQESRTPDIGVLRTICEKYNVSADYMIGLMADENHAVSDVCRETGLSPKAAKVLKQLNPNDESGIMKHDPDLAHLLDPINPAYRGIAEGENVTAIPNFAGPITELLNALLETKDGVQLLTLLSAIILGVDAGDDLMDDIYVRINSSTGSHSVLPISLKDLSSSLWINIQYFAHSVRDSLNPAEFDEPIAQSRKDTIQILRVDRDNPDQKPPQWSEMPMKEYKKSLKNKNKKNSESQPSDTV
jgi:transcriptional regulator with XRE-family HTH domain